MFITQVPVIVSNFTYFYNREMVQGDLESTNANHVRSCPYLPSKIKLYPDEGQSSIDGNDRIASTSDLNSTHTDNQSAKHTLEQVDENSVLVSTKESKQVKIRSPTKETIKCRPSNESRLREQNIDLGTSTAHSNLMKSNQINDEQLSCVLTTNTSTQSSIAEQRLDKANSKLERTNCKLDCTDQTAALNVYVNVDNQSSATTSTQLKKPKSDYI